MRTFKFIDVLVIALLFIISCKDNTQQNKASNTITEVKTDINRIEPPHWWTGFVNTQLQLLVKHPNIGKTKPQIDYHGVTIEKVHKADSPNYLFIDLYISPEAKAGKFNITFKFKNEEELTQTYELKERLKRASDYVGFNSSDAIYLITPDRFANANPNNDSFQHLNEKTIDRSDDYARHGGDIQGITKHLDYITDLGFTALWASPLLTNDMPEASYHGYAITDYYQVDPRFGTLEEYIELSKKTKEKGIKLIMDQVANHCGLQHWWMQDLPFKDWINDQENFEANKANWSHKTVNQSNHRRTANQDTYAANIDKQGLANGWFVKAMPDLNQRNPFMAKYIIQNSIWWIETLELGGIRQDTYPYPDKAFMANWAGAIMQEYPNFNIVGEEWSYNPLLIAYWQDGKANKDGYVSNLKSSMDFAMQKNIIEGLNEPESWNKGLVKLYEGLANDFAYQNPKDIMVFLDNHDKSRVFTELKGNVANTKMALSYMLMLPRIPQIYYGTEILMNDFKKPGDHGLIRTDFSGGWQGDAVNAFTGEGLTKDQKAMQAYLKKLLNFRKQSKAIHNGKTIHFAPEEGVYVLARLNGDEVVVHIINKNEASYNLGLSRFEELGLNGKTLRNVITNDAVLWSDNLELKEKGSVILTTN